MKLSISKEKLIHSACLALAFFAVAGFACAQQQNSSPVRYTVTDLGLVGGPPGQPFVIKDNSLISEGVAVSDTTWHAMLWFHGMTLDLAKADGLGGPSSVAFGVNEIGQAVGEAEAANADPNGEDFCGFGDRLICEPFIWHGGAMLPLVPLKDAKGVPGTNAVANAINNSGQVVGTAEDTERDSTCPPVNPALGQYQQFQFKPVLWANGTTRELPTFGGDPDGIAFAINDKGQAVGATGTCTAFQAGGDLTYLYGLHATLWRNGQVQDLGNLGGIGPGGGNVATNINNQGQVIGTTGAYDGSFYAFLWSEELGKPLNLGTVEDDVASVALGINDRGDITGISFDASFNPRAFLRPNGGTMLDLNSLIPANSSLYLFDACSINSSGQIIGLAFDMNTGDLHGYLATPTFGASPAPTNVNRPTALPERASAQLRFMRFGRFGATRAAPR